MTGTLRVAPPLDAPFTGVAIRIGDAGIERLEFKTRPGSQGFPPNNPLAHRILEAITAYFAGETIVFEPLLTAKGADFQRRAWAALAAIHLDPRIGSHPRIQTGSRSMARP